MPASNPAPVYIIKDLETLKVFADPLRNQVLELLAAGPLTVTEIADRLGFATSKLYYHINQLEKSGFIRVSDTTVKGNIIEKHYWLTAYECQLDYSLCNFATPEGQVSIKSSFLSMIETTREDMERSLTARADALAQGAAPHPREVVVFRELRRVSDETANKIKTRLQEVAKEFDALVDEDEGGDVHVRALTIAFYPSFYFENHAAD